MSRKLGLKSLPGKGLKKKSEKKFKKILDSRAKLINKPKPSRRNIIQTALIKIIN